MIVKPETFKKLIAVRKGKIVKIPNRILRKNPPVDIQETKLSNESICIVCNFIFGEETVKFSPKIKAVCHPFRSENTFSPSVKKYLFSESDFCDKMITPYLNISRRWEGRYDFVYFFLNSDQGVRSKGLYMAPMIGRVAKNMGLKGLMIGYQGSKSRKLRGTVYDKAYKKVKAELGKIENIEFMYKKFRTEEVCEIMKAAKFVLYPNTADASPRLLTEAIVRGVPVVVNKEIYGGWKYIDDTNGRFFDGLTVKDYVRGTSTIKNEESLEKAMREVLLIDRDKVEDTFYNNYGFKNSAVRLASIINDISSTKYIAVAFSEWEPFLEKIAKENKWL